MTSEDVRSELERHPFTPLRLHLASGKTVDVLNEGMTALLQNAVLVFHARPRRGYDIIALRNIERLEQLDEQEASC